MDTLSELKGRLVRNRNVIARTDYNKSPTFWAFIWSNYKETKRKITIIEKRILVKRL